jgi:Winged helix DNA-binding domain
MRISGPFGSPYTPKCLHASDLRRSREAAYRRAVRTLTLRELNRATLTRQLLLERRPLSVTRAVERVAGVQAQWPPSPYLGLWSRIEGFRAEQLERAIARRHVVKATLMRTTLHLVSARDYLAYAGIYRERRIGEMERQLAAFGEHASFAEDGARLAALAAEQPRSRPELLALLGIPKLELTDRRPWLVWYGLSAYAGLLNGPDSSRWRWHTGRGTFVPARTWLGADGDTGNIAVAHLLRRYLAAFGPATRPDMAQWTGLPLSVLDPGLEQLRLRGFRDELGRQLYDLPGAPLPSADTPAPVRLMPRFDNLVLSHADRRRVITDEHRAVVIVGGEVLPTILVDGFVAGTWALDDGRVRLAPFGPLPERVKRELADESARLEAFVRASAPS